MSMITEQVEELREEAGRAIGKGGFYAELMGYHVEALNMAIKALEQKPCEDCISREKAKQFLYERLDILNDDELYDIFSRVIDDMYNELPSITPIQSWIPVSERLPEEHERLIDVGQCDRELFYQQCGGANSLITVKTAFDMLLSLPPIIEADKAESEDKE